MLTDFNIVSCPTSHLLTLVDCDLIVRSGKNIFFEEEETELETFTVEGSFIRSPRKINLPYETTSHENFDQEIAVPDKNEVGPTSGEVFETMNDSAIEWSSQESTSVSNLLHHREQPRKRHYSFESEESLENISDLREESAKKESEIEGIVGLEELVNRLNLEGATRTAANRSGRDSGRKSRRIIEWFEGRTEEEAEAGCLVAYSLASAHAVRSTLLSDTLNSAQRIKSSKMEMEKNRKEHAETKGNVLIVTSKGSIDEWLSLVDEVDGHMRTVDYSVSVAKRRSLALRISDRCADVVVTTWDVLKAKEVAIGGEPRSYCHGMQWRSILVDFVDSRMPSDKNQAGKAIASLRSMANSSSISGDISRGNVRIRNSLVRVEDNDKAGQFILDPFLPKMARMAGLRNVGETFFDAR